MRSRRSRHDKPSETDTAALGELMETMFRQAKAQFGAAVKSFWFYDGDLCPACMQRPIGVVKFRGKEALAINAFIYRARGVLIGYFLCETCVTYIFDQAQKHPYRQTPLHADIESHLTAAYHRHLARLDA